MTIFKELHLSRQHLLGLCQQIIGIANPSERRQLFRVFAQELSCHEAAASRYLFTELAQLGEQYHEIYHINMVQHHEFDEMSNNLSMLPENHTEWLTEFTELAAKLKQHITHESRLFADVASLFSDTLQKELGKLYRDYMQAHLHPAAAA